MGMFDTLIVLDDVRGLHCPSGHGIRSFQTKDLDQPSMSKYLVQGGRLYLAINLEDALEADETIGWRVVGSRAVREYRYELREVPHPGTVSVFGHCDECEPILVRSERATFLGDIVMEHSLFLDFRLTFRRGEPLQIERVSGTRDELCQDLRSRGSYVLADDDPLAVAHRHVKHARDRSPFERSISR